MGLFPQLPDYRFFQRLARLNDPAGDRPLAQARLLAAFDQKDLIVAEDDSPNSDDRVVGIFAFHVAYGNQMRLSVSRKKYPDGNGSKKNLIGRRFTQITADNYLLLGYPDNLCASVSKKEIP